MENIIFENNICRYAGYGFGSLRDGVRGGDHLVSPSGSQTTTGFIIRNNIFDTSKYRIFYLNAESKDNLPVLENNTYIQYNNSVCGRYMDSTFMFDDNVTEKIMSYGMESNPTVYYSEEDSGYAYDSTGTKIVKHFGRSNELTLPIGAKRVASKAFAKKVKLYVVDLDLTFEESAVVEGCEFVAHSTSKAHEYAKKNNVFFTYTDAENVLTADYNDDSAVNVKDLLRLKKHTADQNGISILRQAKPETVSGFNAEAITDLCKRIIGLIG